MLTVAFAGFVALLSKPARQALPIIRSAIRRGVGADTTFQTLRTRFPGLTREAVRGIARVERRIISAGADLRFMNREVFPNPNRLPPALTTLRRKFSFRVRLRGFDPATGESVDDFVTISTDRLRTRGELEDTARTFMERDPKRYALSFTEVLLVEGVRAGPGGIL